MGVQINTEVSADFKKLSQCSVLDSNGNNIPLSSLWNEKPVVLIFLRHFGCEICSEHIHEILGQKDILVGKGAQIHFIGNGMPECIDIFKKKFGFQDISIFTDPTLKTFQAAGFRRGFWVCANSARGGLQFVARGVAHQIREPETGDVWQLGGILVIRPSGQISYQFISQALGDFPPRKDASQIIKVGAPEESY